MNKRLFFSILALIAAQAYGGFLPPSDWEVAKNPPDKALLAATHDKSALIMVLKEDRKDFDVKSLLEFTKLKTDKFRATREVSEETKPTSGRVAGCSAWSTTLRTIIASDDGKGVDTRIKLVCFEHGDSYYTIALGSKIEKESIYYPRFIRYLNSITLD